MSHHASTPFLRGKRMLFLLALLSAFPPLSTDMYLPTLPHLQTLWQQPATVINLTLSSFFVSFGLALLVYGPLSDRYGRKRPLIVGSSLFVGASLLCAMAWNVESLIAFRTLQSMGAASASAMSLAITRDVYSGAEREKVMAIIAVIMGLAPMLAPTIGSWVLTLGSWRWIFVLLAGVGVASIGGVLQMPETAGAPSVQGPGQVISAYRELMFGNARFATMTFLLSLISVVHFGFVGGSSLIYIQEFGLSEQTFGYLFAFNASMYMLGSFVCRILSGRIPSYRLVFWGLAGVTLSCVFMLLPIFADFWRLTVPMAVASVFYGLSRPPTNNLILEQVDRHVGSAASLLTFTFFLVAAAAMWFIALEWPDRITTLGVMGAGVVGAVWVVWSTVMRRTLS